MFEPELQNIDCPKCFQRRVYFDREIGYYCMFCGHEFTAEEMMMLIEKTTLTSRPAQHPDKSEKKPAAEIKELPPRKKRRAERVSRDTTEPKKPEQKAPDS